MAMNRRFIDPELYAVISYEALEAEVDWLEFCLLVFRLLYVEPALLLVEAAKAGEPVKVSRRREESYKMGIKAYAETRRRYRLATTEQWKRLNEMMTAEM